MLKRIGQILVKGEIVMPEKQSKRVRTRAKQ
jgi:hypothetical protein